ncbi:uncharacterized protein TrAFT101_010880 [Trichoderma asperellum]|uniref:uncharacterized protein n=1 Tax=Trichoderma asperellum TaxID=101201 RepID=UPI00331BF73A|nr:hypothetical protein TrAFT101_010880 [Trichoderma asperellum]
MALYPGYLDFIRGHAASYEPLTELSGLSASSLDDPLHSALKGGTNAVDQFASMGHSIRPNYWYSSSSSPLVTGCSSGFGRVFVDEILRRGNKVIATACRPESVADLKKTNATVLQLDVTWDWTRIIEAIDDAIGIHGHIDVFVNNAAYVLGGAWEDLSEDSKAFKLPIDKNHTQSGDPQKGVAIIVDLVRQEGVAKDETVPLRMPLSPDAYEVIKNKCDKTINLLGDWKDVISSTDLDE